MRFKWLKLILAIFTIKKSLLARSNFAKIIPPLQYAYGGDMY